MNMGLSKYIEELNRLYKKYGDVDILEEYHRDDDTVKYYDVDGGPFYIDYNGVSGIVCQKVLKRENY